MKRVLQIVALLIVLAAIAFWAARGANRGWTKTQVEVRTLDEITGIEGVGYEDRFVPGVDFVGAALLGAGILAGGSLLIRNKPKNQN